MRQSLFTFHLNKSKGTILYWFFFTLGLLRILYLFLNSPGVPVQDEVGQFLYSKASWEYPQYLLNLWGRPLRTLMYLIPSRFGFNFARLFSILLASFTVLISTKLARNLDVKRLYLIPVLLWFQPWYLDLSYTVIPQVLFSLLLISAVYFISKQKFTYSSILIGLLPLTRHEGMALLGVWTLYLLIKRKWKMIVISISAILIFNLFNLLVFHEFAFSIYLNPKPTTLYGSGTWFHFISPLVKNVGYPILLLSIIGVIPIIRNNKTGLLGFYLLYFLVHTIIYKFGFFASGGYYFFLLPLAPAFCVLSAIGLEEISTTVELIVKDSISRSITINSILIFTLGAVVFLGIQTKPRPLDIEGSALKQAYEWIQHSGIEYPELIATHIWFYYFSNLPLYPELDLSNPPPPESLAPGSLVVWDWHYSNRWGLKYDHLINPLNGWEEIMVFENGVVVIFQKKQ